MDFVITPESILIVQAARSGISPDGSIVNDELKTQFLEFINKNFI
jgi:hypothetical protein